VIAASKIAAAAGFPRLIGLDMGGTSTDVFLIDTTQGPLQLRSESQISGLPVSVPMLDVHTVGAGGGSLARFDSGGLLRVGPESAGSDPGPICFGIGEKPTVTDANLLLGRLDDQQFLNGSVTLNSERARNAFSQYKGPLGTIEEFAAGILRVVESNMERAIRFVSVERGHDPRDFALLAFGGGGPLHACALARSLRISKVIVPAIPGALSAMGILLADSTRELSRTVMLPGAILNDLDPHFQTLQADIPAEFASEKSLILERSVDLRYKGQGYELNVLYSPDAAEAFHALHQRHFGFSDRNREIEIVNVRLRLRIPAEAFTFPAREPHKGDGSQALRGKKQIYFDANWLDAQTYDRDLLQPGDSISGPALIGEYTSTTVLPPDCSLEVDGLGNLIIAIPTGDNR
jgi:N-methylhydantoinase A